MLQQERQGRMPAFLSIARNLTAAPGIPALLDQIRRAE